MKKIKFLIASMIGAIALVFTCVFGSVNVNAANYYKTSTNSYFKYSFAESSLSWECISKTAKSLTDMTQDETFGILGRTSDDKVRNDGHFEIKANTGIYLPVPKNSSGTIILDSDTNGNKVTMSIFDGEEILSDSGKQVTLTSKADAVTLSFESSDLYTTDEKNYYVGINTSGNYKCKVISVSLNNTYFISTPVLEQQENASGSAIRYIATVEGVTSDAAIASWTVTMSINIDGKSDYVVTFTYLYTAVGGTNGKSAADDTVYLVATWKNIPSGLNGKTVSTNFKVTLSDSSSTVLTSNTVEFTINVK